MQRPNVLRKGTTPLCSSPDRSSQRTPWTEAPDRRPDPPGARQPYQTCPAESVQLHATATRSVTLLLAALAITLATLLLLAVALLAAALAVTLAALLLLAVTLLAAALAVTLAALLLLAVALLAAPLAVTLLAVALLTGGVEGGLLVAVVPAGLITAEPGLLLGVEVLLVTPVLQLLWVDPQAAEQPGVLLGVDLAHALQLLCGLLVVATELADQVHDRRRVEVHGTSPFCRLLAGCCTDRPSPAPGSVDPNVLAAGEDQPLQVARVNPARHPAVGEQVHSRI